ncbi:Cas1p-domain-containing protein [Annulohypoxylon truncatum]|uniref:Cas1p-domain-containing protein n=1 Tax=Annulohypoxylon truncatum TaxID=327061 RepID=UPI002007DA17|nr:Cas1p-domain-containing protein [Annulohypoxylon truncatum]KAI1213060.1 Cas1p-domain-containing protein [Annulohypoxylon truncatum]
MLEQAWVRLTIAFTLIGVFLLQQQHQSQFGQQDPYRCRALLHDGAWSPAASDGPMKWEPKNCRMGEYPRDALRTCLKTRKAVFVGDSTIRQVFWAAAKRLELRQMRVAIGNSTDLEREHQSVSFEGKGVKLDFIWDPWLNSSKLEKTLKNFHTSPTPPNEFTIRKEDDESPALILVGAPGLWAARYGGDDYLDIFKRGINRIKPYISDAFEENMRWGFDFGPGDLANHVLLAPVQVPEYEHLSPSRHETITASRIRKMNDYLSGLSQNQSSHIPWVYNKLSVGSGNDFTTDGLHVSDSIAAHKLDIAINAHCNALSSHIRTFKGTCCISNYRNKIFNLAWEIAAFIGLASIVIELTVGVSLIEHEIINAAKVIVAIGLWAYYCDRTTFFGKLERHYEPVEFIVMCLLWLVVSIFSMKRIPKPTDLPERSVARLRQERNPDPPGYGPGYLSREHCLEIKGLMQGFILLYHYHYASQALWVYKIIRVFISGYFFLTAYGHTLYFLRTNDYSFRRVSAILFRLNLLSALLPYAMDTDYSLYYFAPVITFWYLVLYAMLRFFRGYNNELPWLIAKVIATAMMTAIFISKHGVLESAARLSHVYLNVNWNAREMRFRLQLDRYIIFVGVIVGALVHKARSRPILPTDNGRRPLDRRLVTIVCTANIMNFFYFIQHTLHKKANYNKIHPFISFIPILSFIVLRSSIPRLRHVYLRLPALLGQMSLETYVLQYHVWLAANATAKHTFGLWDDV